MEQDLSIETMQMTRAFLRMLRPHRVDGIEKLRIGRLFDGGYVMLDRLDGTTAAYSLGLNDDVSWDLDIAMRGIPVYQYDHTIAALPAEHELFNWKRIGIGVDPDPLHDIDSLANLMRENGHASCNNLILKCDIEGSEWRVLAEAPFGLLKQFTQIIVEFHGLQDLRGMPFANIACKAVRNITSTHRVVHVHGNNFARWTVVGGIPLPAVLEVTFARLDSGTFTVSDETFPTELDMPCHSREADLFLGRFEFP